MGHRMCHSSVDFRLIRKLFELKGAQLCNFSVFGRPGPLCLSTVFARPGLSVSISDSSRNYGRGFTRVYDSPQRRNFGSSALFASTRNSFRVEKWGLRMYSSNNGESGNQPRTEMKGVVVHIPHPIEWLKSLCYLFVVQGWLDSSFNRQEFLLGAKQAVCHLTRLAVLKDFDAMKLVSSTEVVGRMKEIVSSLSSEQLQSIEILPENINLAKFNVSSVNYLTEGSFTVSIDVFCLAIRMFQSQPLLIQVIMRFSRNYEQDHQSDWRIASIQEFNIREMGASKEDGRGQ